MIIRTLAALMIAALLVPGVAVQAPENTNSRMRQENPTASAEAPITAEEAEAIALTHAGLTAGQVTFSRTEHEIDDGRPEFEIEFRYDNWEYDYTIHARTGAVLSHDREYDPPRTPPAVTEPPATEPPATELTAEDAKAAALAHAGLTAGQVTHLRAEYDYDDGVPVYEVEFRQGRWEYEYEIHAKTGTILSWDKDD